VETSRFSPIRVGSIDPSTRRFLASHGASTTAAAATTIAAVRPRPRHTSQAAATTSVSVNVARWRIRSPNTAPVSAAPRSPVAVASASVAASIRTIVRLTSM
jgi:hypothetical protein